MLATEGDELESMIVEVAVVLAAIEIEGTYCVASPTT